MESTNALNDFIGSPVFMTIVVIVVIVIGLLLRLIFKSSNSEYKHKPDD